MNKKIKYDTKSAKGMVLLNAGHAYYALGRANNDNTYQEEELIAYAMSKVLEEDTGDEEQFLELRGLSYMLRGIADNLRLFCDEPTELSEDEIKEPFQSAKKDGEINEERNIMAVQQRIIHAVTASKR